MFLYFFSFAIELIFEKYFYWVTSTTICDSCVGERDQLMHVTENKKKNMSWYLTQLKLRSGNDAHRRSWGEPNRIGVNIGLSTGFKILWGIIPAYCNIYRVSLKSQSLGSIFYITLVLSVGQIRKYRIIIQVNMELRYNLSEIITFANTYFPFFSSYIRSIQKSFTMLWSVFLCVFWLLQSPSTLSFILPLTARKLAGTVHYIKSILCEASLYTFS